MINNIRQIVKNGYENGDYTGHFRVNSSPNNLEKKYLDILSRSLPKSTNVLDLGCGIGIPFDKYLVEKGFNLTGIDFASNHIKAAKKNVPNARFIEGDFTKINFENLFHAIIAFYSIFHIPRDEHQTLFEKMYNLLKKNGHILITLGTRNEENIEEDFVGAPMAWSKYEPKKYEIMLSKIGFEIVKSEYEGQPGDKENHWWIIATKN